MNPKLPTFFKDPHLIAQKDACSPILIALSGGADSAMLLHLLCLLREERDFPLYAAHVNHGIRTEAYGDEAKRDEDFCREICREANVPLFVASYDIPSLAQKSGKSLETEAREARYSFFRQRMDKEGIEILATAHNADDNLETQIFNLCRGCGTAGICGIPEKRILDSDSQKVAVRPILGAKKSDVISFCLERGINFVTDSTNLENDCTRNRIRNIIIPELVSLFNSPQSAALRLSKAAREDNDYLTLEAKRFIADRIPIPVDELRALPLPIAKRALILAFENHSHATLEEVHIQSVLELAWANKSGCTSLPGKMRARIDSCFLYFESDTDEKPDAHEYCVRLSEGLTAINGTPYAVGIEKCSPIEEVSIDGYIYRLYSHTSVKGLDLSLLCAGSRREGEVISDGGMHKKLKKLMCDKKIPTHLRDLPIIRENDEAIYVPLCAVCDRVKTKKADAEYFISVYVKLP